MIKQQRWLVPVMVLVFSLLAPELVSAATPQLQQAGLRLGRLSASAGTGSGNDVLVTFKLRTTPTSVSEMAITFPSGFNLTAGTTTATTSPFPNTPASIVATPTASSLTATTTSNGSNLGGTIVVTNITSASLSTSNLYGFIIPDGVVQNPSSGAAQYTMTLASRNSSHTVIDQSSVATYITTSGGDQVTVNATVAAYFSFSLSGTTDTIPAIDKTSIQTSPGITMTVATNASLGYTAYVKSATGGLHSTNASFTIPTGTFNTTPDTLTAGTSEYAFVPTNGSLCVGGCGAASPVYDGEYAGLTAGAVGSPSTGGSFNSTNFSSFVSRATYTASDSYLLQERAAVSGAVPYATDYTDTLTIVAAGNF